MLVALLVAYSLGASFLIARARRRAAVRGELDGVWQNITANSNPSADDIKAIAEIARVRQTEIPWYERSLSTIGTIAFFSMIVATTIQTINSAKAEIESYSLRKETKVLESQRDLWKRLVRELSEVITLKQAAYGKIEKSEQELLRQRLGQIEEVEKPGREEDTERLKIYLALREYDEASALIAKSKFLVDDASLESLLFLAEMSFVDGAKGNSAALLGRFESQMSKQPVEWQLRYFVIRAALDSDPKPYASQVAALKGLRLEEAEEWLDAKMGELRLQASRRSLGTTRLGEH